MKTSSIVPAIMPRSRAHLSEMIGLVAGVAPEVQIDTVDGKLAPEISWPHFGEVPTWAPEIMSVQEVIPADMTYEVDLMVSEPDLVLEAWCSIKPHRVVLHVESFLDGAAITAAIAAVRTCGALAILSADNDTPIDTLLDHLADADGVQCMGIAAIGRQGNPFDERVLDRIVAIRGMYPQLSISVDGSVNESTLPALKDAGADRFVVGSGIFASEDPLAAYARLSEMV